MDSGVLIGPVVGVITLIIVGLGILAYRRSATTAQADLPTEWQQRSEGSHVYQLKFRPSQGTSNNRRPAMLSLRVATATDLDLEIKRETWFDRLAKNLGIAREFQTGDRKFDEALYLRGELDYRVGMALKQSEVRTPVLSLFQDGCTELRQQQRWLQADWTGFNPAKTPLPGAAAIANLMQIAAALPAHSNMLISGQRMVKVLLWTVTAVLGCSFILGLDYPPLRWWPLWRMVIPTAVVAWLLLAWTAAWCLRGHSRSHDHWGLYIAVSLLTSVIGSLGLLGYYNGHYDRAASVVQHATVVDKWTTRNKSRTRYHIAVADWAHPGQSLDFDVEPGVYTATEPGRSTLVVASRPGRLGVEWLQGFHVESP